MIQEKEKPKMVFGPYRIPTGGELRFLRKSLGLTQYNISERSGLSPNTVRRLENPEVKCRVESLRRALEVIDEEMNGDWPFNG